MGKLAVEIIDQPLDRRLPPLQSALPRPEGVPKFALDHRLHRLALPPLSVDPIQPRLIHPLRPRPPLRGKQVPSPPDGRDQVPFLYCRAVEAAVGHQQPGPFPSLPAPVAPSLPLKPCQEGGIAPRSLPRPPGQDPLGLGPHRVDPLDPPDRSVRSGSGSRRSLG